MGLGGACGPSDHRQEETSLFGHLTVLCDSLRCRAYGTFCYGIWHEM